jgi:L-serine dehydratase
MTASVFDLFKLGVGPSSSHTMGPMTAAVLFVGRLRDAGRLPDVARVETRLYASLALTGRGHATDRAVILGLMGFVPARLDPDAGEAALLETQATQSLNLGGDHPIAFDEARDIVWAGHERLPQHPNGLTFTAFDAAGVALVERTYFSIGGGFVRDESEMGRNAPPEPGPEIPHPFESGADLLQRAADAGLSIAGVMGANELARMDQDELDAGLDRIFEAMEACIERGMREGGILPGGLDVKRRARQIHQTIQGRMERQISDPLAAMDFVNLWAMAVNEENAAGGRVVTAPTNGAAGLIPRCCASTTASTTARRRGCGCSC